MICLVGSTDRVAGQVVRIDRSLVTTRRNLKNSFRPSSPFSNLSYKVVMFLHITDYYSAKMKKTYYRVFLKNIAWVSNILFFVVLICLLVCHSSILIFLICQKWHLEMAILKTVTVVKNFPTKVRF
jgi:isoprenylcysteine carboxyl methyltransferase (ICMT) family protein YpbQ